MKSNHIYDNSIKMNYNQNAASRAIALAEALQKSDELARKSEMYK